MLYPSAALGLFCRFSSLQEIWFSIYFTKSVTVDSTSSGTCRLFPINLPVGQETFNHMEEYSSSELIYRSGIAMLASVKWEHSSLTLQKAPPDDSRGVIHTALKETEKSTPIFWSWFCSRVRDRAGIWEAAGQRGHCCAFDTHLCGVDPTKRGWSQLGSGLRADGGGISDAALHGSAYLALQGRLE